MIKDFELCRIMSKIAQSNSLGQFIAVYNDFEQKWSYFIGMFRDKNPADRIVKANIDGVEVTHILENRDQYFSGIMSRDDKIVEYVKSHYQTDRVNVDFDFPLVAFR